MSGHEEPVPHPAMGDATSALTLLNNYTRTVLVAAARAEVPDGWTLMVAADSDLVLNHPLSGDWVGLRLVGGGSVERRPSWRAVRGPLAEPDIAFDDDLRRAISYFVTQHARRQMRVGR